MNLRLAKKLKPHCGRGARGAALVPVILSLLLAASPASFMYHGIVRAEDGLVLSQPLVVRWQYKSDLTVNLTPAVSGTRVFLPLAGGGVVSLNGTDGQLLWKSDTGGEISASPGADENKVYVASEYGDVATVNRTTKGALRALGVEAGVTRWMR